MAGDPVRAARRVAKEDPQMELAALVLFGSIALWFLAEARGTGSL